MKRYLVPLALAAFALACAFLTVAQTMRTANTTNDLVLLSPYTINTNTYVVTEGTIGDGTATWWTFVAGDATGPDATHLQPLLYPTAGRWVKNTGGSGGTNIFNTIITTNLYASNTYITNIHAEYAWISNTYITNLTVTNTVNIRGRVTINTNVYFTNVYVTINGTNVAVVNPTTPYVPYRNSPTNFLDSAWYMVGGTNIGIDSQIIFGPGTTNVLYLSGDSLVYTNGAAGPSFKVLAGTGTGARVYAATGGGRAMLQAIGLAGAGLGVDGNSDGVVFQGSAFIPLRDNTTSLSGPTSSTWFKDIGAAGTNYVSAFKDATATNYDRLAIYGTPTALVFDSQALTNNLTAPALPFSFRTNGVEVFNVTGTGGPSSAANWVASGATDSTLAGTANAAQLYYGATRVFRTALTPIDAGTQMDFALTNRSWTLSLTGAVSLTTANLLAGKCGNILITNAQATNCNFTFPAWIFIGYKPTYITAGKCARLDLESTATADAAIYAYYGEQQ